MPRTKMSRKKSSVAKKGRSILPKHSQLKAAASIDSLASSATDPDESDDLNALLTSVYESSIDFEKCIEFFYKNKIEARQKKYEKCVNYVKDLIANQVNSLPDSYLNAILIDRFDESILEGLNIDFNSTTSSGHISRLQKSKQESAEFKKPKTPRRVSSRNKRSLSAPAPSAPLRPQEFKTPLNSARQQMAMIKSITPKVSNTPVSVMRRPQHGEVAFSTSGSPLLIGPVSREDIPTVSVPMQDGRVFSILPDPGLPPPDLPQFDDETKKYLRTLREHLAMLSNSPET